MPCNHSCLSSPCELCEMRKALALIIKEIEASAGSDPSWETNRQLKKDWAKKLREASGL